MTLFGRVSVLALLLVSSVSWGDELANLKARNAQLEATVEELTLQLAESVKERRRLEAQLANTATAPVAVAPAVISDGDPEIIASEPINNAAAPAPTRSKVVNGCDVDYALGQYAASKNDNEQLQKWLESSNNAQKCSSDQLRKIRDAVTWDFWGYSREVRELIDRELAKRD